MSAMSHSADTSHHERTSRRRIAKITPICKTCQRCRAKKAKCDGSRPACAACAATGHACKYPKDERLATRPTRAEVEALRDELDRVRQLLSHSGSGHQQPDVGHFIDRAYSGQTSNIGSVAATASDEPMFRSPHQTSQRPAMHSRANTWNGTSIPTIRATTECIHIQEASIDSTGPPSDDTHIACAVEEDGSLDVHGVSSYLRNPAARTISKRRRSNSTSTTEARMQTVKDHLFANAAYQRQREMSLFQGIGRSFGPRIDFDGVAPELALHLLELHWNRQHYLYLMTYRPAFIDSLATNGPYASKLLLNSLYFSSSSLESDRPVFKTDVNEPRRRGEKFYTRFKTLLADELDRPSLPTIVALISTGTTLVSTGAQNAGWIYCGIAYRMVVDMGLHLSTAPWQSESVPETNLTAIEIEMRTRIYWACFMIDNYQSLYLGRPPYLRAANARTTRDFCDCYEELENWAPYVDPAEPPSEQNALLASYQPRPIYAISAFQIFTMLGEIASFITPFYALDCLEFSAEHHLRAKQRIRNELDAWKANLPSHLRFDPLVDPVPPPNQIVPHALYHTLIILLERPFLPTGHLSSTSNAGSQAAGQARCIQSAFHIWHLLEAYQKTFTFRRTPYLLSYATYCAIVVLLNQKRSDGDQYDECIKFFWFALLRQQKGTHFGLRKPLKILQGLMRRVGQTMPDSIPREKQSHEYQQTSLDATRATPNATFRYPEDPWLEDFLQQNVQFGDWPAEGWTDTMLDEYGQIDDSLIGLMSPGQPIMNGFVPTYR